MNFATFEACISEKGGTPNMKSIKLGNIIEYVLPGLGKTSTGRVVEVGKLFVVLIDDNTQQCTKVSAEDLSNTYENKTI